MKVVSGSELHHASIQMPPRRAFVTIRRIAGAIGSNAALFLQMFACALLSLNSSKSHHQLAHYSDLLWSRSEVKDLGLQRGIATMGLLIEPSLSVILTVLKFRVPKSGLT